MEPVATSLLLNVAGNALTSILSRTGRRWLHRDRGTSTVAIPTGDPTVRELIEQIASEAYDNPPRFPLIDVPGARRFLESSEVQTITRQLLLERYTGTQNDSSSEAIRDQFLRGLALYTDRPEADVRESGIQVFEHIQDLSERILTKLIETGVLAAHELRSLSRHQTVLGELSSIHKSIQLISSKSSLNIEQISKYEDEHRQQMRERTNYIIAPSLDSVLRLPIEEIYVQPALIPSSHATTGPVETRIEVDHFLNYIHRAVILGNPGGGKSTLARKITHDLASSPVTIANVNRSITPFLITLRDYGAEKKARRISIVEYLETEASSSLQIEAPDGAIDYLLLKCHALVIFDGLDELLDTSYRQQISDDIESFCNLYPSVPVIVTSREVGYEQAPLDARKFTIFSLAPFDDAQVNEYVKKWFSSEYGYSTPSRVDRAALFMEESRVVPDLRSNPLMLALMCNIYRGENYIPRNRPEVYRKCSLMLFEKWDQSRDIRVQLPFETQVRPAMMYLAFRIYSDSALQAGVTEGRLISDVADYLHQWQFESWDEAERGARQFVEFCRGRAWVFSEVGLTPDNEGLYQFTHRTFLEYFTAAYLDRIYRTPADLMAVLLPRIAEREWDVVAQLALQIQGERMAGAADELLESLLASAGDGGGDRQWNLLSFAARCLGFIVPTLRSRRAVADACIEYVLQARSGGVTRPAHARFTRFYWRTGVTRVFASRTGFDPTDLIVDS